MHMQPLIVLALGIRAVKNIILLLFYFIFYCFVLLNFYFSHIVKCKVLYGWWKFTATASFKTRSLGLWDKFDFLRGGFMQDKAAVNSVLPHPFTLSPFHPHERH